MNTWYQVWGKTYQCQISNAGGWFISVKFSHDGDVTMGAMASQITSLTIVYSAVYSGANQRKHQSSASLAFVWGIHRWPVNSPHKWPVKRKMFPFDDIIMEVPWLFNDFWWFFEVPWLFQKILFFQAFQTLWEPCLWVKKSWHLNKQWAMD